MALQTVVVASDEVCYDIHGGAGRPRDEVELNPEPAEHDRHVEAEYKRDRDEVAEVETVHRHRLKHPARSSIVPPSVIPTTSCHRNGGE